MFNSFIKIGFSCELYDLNSLLSQKRKEDFTEELGPLINLKWKRGQETHYHPIPSDTATHVNLPSRYTYVTLGR